jgi:hypothetical protein
METTYNWVIAQMETKPQEGELNDVVSTIHWRRQATAVDGDNTYFADTYGAMGCATPSETDFTAYPDLTFEQVCGWLEAGLDVEALNANLDAQIENQINPPIIVLPNPWNSTPPAPTTTSTTTVAPE